MKKDSGHYGLRLGGILIALVVVSVGAVYYLYGGRDVVSLQQVFGEPLTPPRPRPVSSPLRTVRADEVREGRLSPDSVAPARSEPPAAAARDSAAGAPGNARDGASATVSPSPSRAAGTAPSKVSPRDRARVLATRKDYEGALRIYDALAAAAPSDTALAHERARVLAWSGRAVEAVAAMRPLVRRSPGDASLLLEQGRYLWWAGDGWAADSALTAALDADPSLDEARRLRRQVRISLDPAVPVAERWLREDATAPFHLLLARALAREGHPAEALREYALAQAMGVYPDSLHLEVAAVALTADSPAVAVAELEVFASDHPGDRDVALRLARAYGLAGETDHAIALYGKLLEERDDPTLRYERARLYASTENWRAAEPDLRAVIAADPDNAAALKLLGDLARWGGHWEEALDWYARAAEVDPALDGLAAARAQAQSSLAEATAAEAARASAGDGTAAVSGAPVPTGAVWSLRGEAFGDSKEFRWFETDARAGWSTGRGLVGASVYQALSHGLLAGGLSQKATALGAAAFGQWLVARDVLVTAEGGFRWFDGLHGVPSLRASVGTASVWPRRLQLDLSYGPAVRRVASAAALAADVRSTLLSGRGERYGDRWGIASEGEVEHLSSSLGDTYRFAGTLTVQRLLLRGLYGVGSLGFVGTDGAAPLLPTGAPLYWTPAYYVAPQLGLRYQTRFADDWRLGLRLAPGYAWVRERGADRRFNRQHLPFLATGLDITYAPSPWDAGLSLDWGGALRDGYRAGAVRVWISPHLRWP